MIITQEDYLQSWEDQIDVPAIRAIRKAREASYFDPKLDHLRKKLQALVSAHPSVLRLNTPVVSIGKPDDVSASFLENLRDVLEEFKPWKKGPFQLFGVDIDSEWRSDLKWERVATRIGSVSGLRVADIGCNNGYFMFRMAADNPELVIGFEPFAKNLMEYEIMQFFAKVPRLYFELLGVEQINLYPEFFDRVFCMGILYHQTDPIETLRKIYRSLKSGGEVIIDCQGIPGEESVALLPAGRYAQARGIWYLPTLPCLINWMRRTQFRDIECFYNEPLSCDEQRTTDWAPVKSLRDFLDPDDITKTIEGYPAPRRFYVIARR
jgi:tRNA (mo5U34)-methyltransferase